MNRKARYHVNGPAARNEGPSHTTAATAAAPSKPIQTQPKGQRRPFNPAGMDEQRLPVVVPSPTLQKGIGGRSLRSIDQTSKMNAANGTMSLSLSIPTTQGRAAFGPKLELAYNSVSGNGPFGLGWQLQVGSITRNISKRMPRYDETDVFLLSGHATGFSVSVFRPRVLGSAPMQIERWTSLGDASNVH